MHPRRIPDDVLLDAMRTVAATQDEPLTGIGYHRRRQPGMPSTAAITARYGSWAASLEAAGLPPTGRRQPRRWKPGEVLDAVGRWLETADDTRYNTYLAAAAVDYDLPRSDAIVRHFGGWRGLQEKLDRRKV